MMIASTRYGIVVGIITCIVWAGYAGPQVTAPAKDSSLALPAAKTVISESGIKRIEFEEQKIEGKIRRPQLVLIKADQRPEFNPMVMQSLGKAKNIATLVDDRLLEGAQYQGAFKFQGTKIVNIEP
jgi:hypothetical protein